MNQSDNTYKTHGNVLGAQYMEQRSQAPRSANDIQHGGNHYKQFKGMEPWDVITGWGLGYLDGTALKYIARWKHKNGVEDLKKAIHFLQKAVEVEEKNNGLSGNT